MDLGMKSQESFGVDGLWYVLCVICETEGRREVGDQHWRECEVDEEGRRVVEVRVYRKRWR